jgi:NADH:ubiquinone oxidoreductase subunit
MFNILKFMTSISLYFTARLVGTDEYQNKYYESKRKKDSFGRKQRFCIYHGTVEASKIPAKWHAWVHHCTEVPLEYSHMFWFKSHTPDVTGTPYAFMPNKHTQFNIHGKYFINKSKDYTAWDGTTTQD